MKKNLLTILYFVLSINLIFANTNQTKIDSIIKNVSDYTEAVQEIRKLDEESLVLYIQDHQDHLTKAKIYNALCWQFFTSDPPKAMQYAQLQYAMVKDLKNEEAIVKAYDNLAYLNQNFNNNEASIKFMLKALKINERNKNKSGISINLSGLANNYYLLNNYPLALNYFEQSLKIEQLAGRWDYEARTLNNIGLCYVALGKISKGLTIYLEAVNIYIRNKKEIKAAATYSNIGLIYLNHKKNYTKALFYLKKAAQFHEQTKNVSTLSGVYGSLSRLYTGQSDFVKALYYGRKALENAKLSNSKDKLMAAHKDLALAFYNKKNYQLAYDYFKISYDLKDTIFNTTSSQQIADMQTKYDTEKKEAENKLLTEKDKLNQLKNKKYKQYLTSVLIIIVLIALIAVLGFGFYRNKQKLALKIAQKNAIIEQQKTTQHKLKALSAQMNPHFIFNSLNSIQYYIATNNIDNSKLFLSKFAKLMRKTLENSEHTFISLAEEITTLKDYIELEKIRMENKFEYNIEIAKNINIEDLNIPTLLLQPYVENAIWHGIAQKGNEGQLKITISEENNHLKCTIEDNGIGRIKAKEIRYKKHKSFAMDITKARLDLINTIENNIINIDIVDKTDKDGKPTGTIVSLFIPNDL